MTNACDRSVKARCVNEISSSPQVLKGSGDCMKSAITAMSNSDRWTSVLRATGIQMLGNHAGRQAGYTLSGTNVEMPSRSVKPRGDALRASHTRSACF